MDGIAGVEARIAAIQARFSSPTVGVGLPGATTDFGSVLAQAQSSSGPSSTSSAPAGAATTDRERWAHDFLTRLGMPVTAENVKLMVAWQKAEGTRAANNPLATTQGMPGATRFNSVGVKNYLSYDDGIAANIAQQLAHAPSGAHGLAFRAVIPRGDATQRLVELGDGLAQDVGHRLHRVDPSRDLAAEGEARVHVAVEVERELTAERAERHRVFAFQRLGVRRRQHAERGSREAVEEARVRLRRLHDELLVRVVHR
jgi:hypothetical protein